MILDKSLLVNDDIFVIKLFVIIVFMLCSISSKQNVRFYVNMTPQLKRCTLRYIQNS